MLFSKSEAESDGKDAVFSSAFDRALGGADDLDTVLYGAAARPPVETGAGAAHFLLFSNTDLWRHGGFAYGGVLWSPHGVDHEGLVVKLIFGGGIYRYVSGALGNAEVIGRQLSAAILPGWRFRRGGLIVTLFAGPEFQSHQLSPDDVSAGLRGRYFGARGAFELWYEPTAMTMIAADASISTIGVSYSARLAGGIRLLELFYGGPEVQAFALDTNYRQYRAGFHVTGLRTGDFEWSAGLGWALDSDNRNSAYGKLGLLTRR